MIQFNFQFKRNCQDSIQKNIQFKIILGQFNSIKYSIQNYSGTIQFNRKNKMRFCAFLGHFWSFRGVFGRFWFISGHFGTFWIILVRFWTSSPDINIYHKQRFCKMISTRGTKNVAIYAFSLGKFLDVT